MTLMRNVQSYLGSIVLTILLAFCLLLLVEESFAETDTGPQDGKIEVVYPVDRLVPYRERRADWSLVFAVQTEQVYPEKFRSALDDSPYEALFADAPVPLMQAQVGIKYNFSLGALGAHVLYASGDLYDDRIGKLEGNQGHDASLDLTKTGASFSYSMDTLFPEPYVVPYIEGQFFRLDWNEKDIIFGSEAGTVDMASAMTVGLLFQLNWLDPDSALQAQNSSNLNNTFLDVFVSQYYSGGDELNPNFDTAMNYGGGLRFEF